MKFFFVKGKLMAKYSKKAQEKVEEAMHEMNRENFAAVEAGKK